MVDTAASDREKDFRTLCTLALINNKHAHYLWSLKRLVKEDLLREGTSNRGRKCPLHDAFSGTQRADAESIDAVVIERFALDSFFVELWQGFGVHITGLRST
jgi:hypothetical protein